MSKKVIVYKNLNLNIIEKINNLIQALVKTIWEIIEISILIVKICSRSKSGFTPKYKKA